MPTDLDAFGLGADVIGIVDHPVRQPKQALFDGLEVGRAGHSNVIHIGGQAGITASASTSTRNSGRVNPVTISSVDAGLTASTLTSLSRTAM